MCSSSWLLPLRWWSPHCSWEECPRKMRRRCRLGSVWTWYSGAGWCGRRSRRGCVTVVGRRPAGSLTAFCRRRVGTIILRRHFHLSISAQISIFSIGLFNDSLLLGKSSTALGTGMITCFLDVRSRHSTNRQNDLTQQRIFNVAVPNCVRQSVPGG